GVGHRRSDGHGGQPRQGSGGGYGAAGVWTAKARQGEGPLDGGIDQRNGPDRRSGTGSRSSSSSSSSRGNGGLESKCSGGDL
ncbi:hypothetical protein OC835_007682, partial [Tilletia horrida]